MTTETFLRKCGEEYLHFIQDKQNLNRGLLREPGYNIHHIHPVGLMGSKTDTTNLVKLTLLEHCIAHALLFKAMPRQATARALRCVAMRNQYQSLTEEEKAFLDIQYGWQSLLLEANRVPTTFETSVRYSIARKGRTCMTDGIQEKMVPLDQITIMESRGFRRGHSDSHCQKTSNQSRGRIYVHNTTVERLVRPEKLEDFLKDGYIRGRLPDHDAVLAKNRKGKGGREKGSKHTEATRIKMSQSHLGKAPANKGRIAVNNGSHVRYIHSEQQQEYLKQGWTLGPLPITEECRRHMSENSRGHKWTEESKAKKREQMRGTVRLYKEGEVKSIRVPLDQKQSYLDQGWTTVRKGADRSSALQRASKTRNAQRKFMKDGIRKWFNPDQFQFALADGWVPVRPL